MATAEKLKKVLDTKLAIKQAIMEKGVAVSDTDTFASYPEKIRVIPTGGGSGEGGADKVFFENRSGIDYNKGDKVLTNIVNIGGIDVGDIFNQSNSFQQSWVLQDGTIRLTSQSNNKGYNIVYTPNGFSETSYPQTVHRLTYPFEQKGDKIITQGSNSKFNVINYRTGEATQYDDYPLTDEILLDWDKGILYNNDKSLSYDTGAGNLTNTQKFFQAFGDTIVYSFTSEVTFIDVSDFPNCTKTVYKLPMVFDQNRCVTGINVGDYYVGAYKGTYYLLRFNGSGYEYDKMIVTKSSTMGFINMDDKLFGFVETDGTPVAYCLEDGVMKRLDIPVDVLNTIKADTSLDTYNRQGFSFNKDFSVVSWDWSTGNYINYSRYAYIKDGVSAYISYPISDNFNYNSSFTGYATGEVDALGRLEVEICLPEKAELTVITNIDVNEDDIVFEGAVV
jgi:hypothetical protein